MRIAVENPFAIKLNPTELKSSPSPTHHVYVILPACRYKFDPETVDQLVRWRHTMFFTEDGKGE
jgi:hypothetical protein